MRTFDVDWQRRGVTLEASDALLAKILGRVARCPGCGGVRVRGSAGLCGYHVQVDCDDPDCYLCRLVFDSPQRLEADLMRPVETREVLWGVKVYRKGGQWVELEAEPWRHGFVARESWG